MPLYTFTCNCGRRDTVFSKISERDAPRRCSCGEPMQRVFEAPSVIPPMPSYQSPVTGKWIDSPSARREDLKRSGSVEWDPGRRQDMKRRQDELSERAIRNVEASIDKTVAEMHASNLL